MGEKSFFDGFLTTGIPSEILYTSLAVTVVVIVALFFIGLKDGRSSRSIWRYVLWALLAEYVFVVICSTIICRGTQSFIFARLELTPFWTYEAVMKHTPGVSVWDIVLNVVLFVPLGFLVKLLFPQLKLWKMLLIAVGSSVLIETNQYLFEKGIAQIDDVMNNTIGAAIGWRIAWISDQGFKKFKSSKGLVI